MPLGADLPSVPASASKKLPADVIQFFPTVPHPAAICRYSVEDSSPA